MTTIYYIDTETHLIRPGVLAPPLVCLQFAQDDGPVGVAVKGVDPVETLLSHMLQTGTLVGHNMAYDALVLMTEYPNIKELFFQAYEEGRVLDTIIREKLRAIRDDTFYKLRDLRLETLAKRVGVKKDSNDPWRMRYAKLEGIPFLEWPRDAREYAIHDVEATRAVFLGQGPQIDDEAAQTRAALVMHYIGATGVFTDPQAVEEFERNVHTRYEADGLLLMKEGLVRVGGTRNTAAARFAMVDAMNKLDLEPLLTDTGAVSLSEEACQASCDPVLEAYQRYGSHKNLLSRLQGLKKGYDTPINARFNSLVETGRTSCTIGSKGGPTNGYQLQNMRRVPGERECFVPQHKGNVFCACDYDSFELCTLSQVCLWVLGFSELGEAIKAGLDPHLSMAANILRMPYLDAQQLYKQGDEKVSQARQGSKIANFGYPGGMGAQSFVQYARGYGMELTVLEAEELKAHWLDTWREMPQYFAWINQHQWATVRRKKYDIDVTTVRQFRSNRLRGGCSYTVACNSYFQGLAADAAKAAGWALMRECEAGELQGWGVWNFIHDEYILEGPAEDAHRAAQVIKRVMESAAQEWIPDIPISASPALMRRWRKEAKPVFNQVGELIPWEDRDQ